jgi:hypothetical protein
MLPSTCTRDMPSSGNASSRMDPTARSPARGQGREDRVTNARQAKTKVPPAPKGVLRTMPGIIWMSSYRVTDVEASRPGWAPRALDNRRFRNIHPM